MNFMSPMARSFTGNGRAPLNEAQLRALAPSIFAAGKHDSRSERYTYVPTWDIVQALMAEGFEPMLAKQGGTRVAGKAEFTKHMVRFRHATHEMRQVGDTRPEIALINSHDGTSSYRILAGLFRLACLNGMVAPAGLVDDVRVGHTGDIRDKVIEGTWSVVGQVERIMERPAAWGSIEVKADEARALARAAHALRFEDGGMQAELIKPEALLIPRREADRGSSLWQTFNRIQENTTKGGVQGRGFVTLEDGRRVHRNTQTREITNIDGDVKLNRALWVLAEEMAKLKGAA
jgi:hypothetical protein